MTELGKQIEQTTVAPGSLLVVWLGQSGYCLKAPDGTTVLIDPYLTNTISDGYRPYIHERLLPPVLDPEEPAGLNGVLYTHDHMDHMDPNTAVQLLWNTEALIVASEAVCERTLRRELRAPENRIRTIAEYETVSIGSLRITAVPANHWEGALGYIVEGEGKCLYFCGDTQLFYEMKSFAERWDIDTAFLCFNGQGGNMDISGAVAAAKMLRVRQVVPAHYGMYADNNGDPNLFELALHKKLPDVVFHAVKAGCLWYL